MVIDFLFQIQKPLDKYKFKQFFSVELKKQIRKYKWQPQGYSVHSVVKLEKIEVYSILERICQIETEFG